MSYYPKYNQDSGDTNRPANPGGNPSIQAFLDEHAFWGITEPLRRMIYCSLAGVTTAKLYPELADTILQSLSPDFSMLFGFVDVLEKSYTTSYNENTTDIDLENTRSFSNGQARAIKSILGPAWQRRISRNIESWCAFDYCAGVVAWQRRTTTARHIIARLMRHIDYAEPYLFTWVAGHASGWDCFEWKNALLRFIAGCYPTTVVERRVMPLLTAHLFQIIPPDSRQYSPRGLFEGAFRIGLKTSQDDRATLEELLEDIEEGIRPGCAAENGRIFREEVGIELSEDQSMDEIWGGAVGFLSRRFPHIKPNIRHPAVRIHQIAHTQSVIDTGFWAGLYTGCPKAFDDYEAWKMK